MVGIAETLGYLHFFICILEWLWNQDHEAETETVAELTRPWRGS